MIGVGAWQLVVIVGLAMAAAISLGAGLLLLSEAGVSATLVATGRGPVTSGLGAEEAGLRLERGYIHVDREFRTGVPGISAIGDVIMGTITFHRTPLPSQKCFELG